MRAFIANTDYDWYTFLSGQPDLDEVNFWKPSGKVGFKALSVGCPLFFKLKQQYDHAIVGFALFVLFRRLSVREAWEVFGTRNGAPTLEAMWKRIAKYTSHASTAPLQPNHRIGCILLTTPIFFPREMWVRPPSDWHPNIVVGKGYDTSKGEGRRIWNECIERANLLSLSVDTEENLHRIADPPQRYGAEQTFRPRLGQGTFRYALEDVYGKCAVTKEHSLPALEASHIIPYSSGGRHELSNGLLLRADIHKLFDRGYVTVTPDYRFRVSGRLREDFDNGKVYYQLEDSPLWLPKEAEDRPSQEYLERHNAECFLDA